MYKNLFIELLLKRRIYGFAVPSGTEYQKSKTKNFRNSFFFEWRPAPFRCKLLLFFNKSLFKILLQFFLYVRRVLNRSFDFFTCIIKFSRAYFFPWCENEHHAQWIVYSFNIYIFVFKILDVRVANEKTDAILLNVYLEFW